MQREGWSVSDMRVQRCVLVFFVPLVWLAAPVAAQQVDTVRVRPVANFEAEVSKLTRELSTQRRMQMEFARLLTALQTKLASPADDSLRVATEAQAELAYQRLRVAATNMAELRGRLEALCSSRPKPEGWLGVGLVGPVQFELHGTGAMVMKYLARPKVESVDPGSPAEKAGIRAGDVVVAIDGREVDVVGIVFAEVLQPGARVAVKLLRSRELVTIPVMIEPRTEAMGDAPCPWVDASLATALAPVPSEFEYQVRGSTLPAPPERRALIVRQRGDVDSARVVRAAPAPSVYTGVMVPMFSRGESAIAWMKLEPLNRELAEPFGVEDGEGLLVLQAAPGTPAARAGLRGGDVLVTANGIKLTSTRALQRAITSAETRSMSLVIVRKRQRQTITLSW